MSPDFRFSSRAVFRFFRAYFPFKAFPAGPLSLETLRNGVHAHVKDAACSDIPSFQNMGGCLTQVSATEIGRQKRSRRKDTAHRQRLSQSACQIPKCRKIAALSDILKSALFVEQHVSNVASNIENNDR